MLFGDGNWIPSEPIPEDALPSAGNIEYIPGKGTLFGILKGKHPIGSVDSCLFSLVPTGSLSHTLAEGEFHTALRAMDQTYQMTIVGSRYRNREQQDVLKHKNKGTLVLLMREPANLHDPNAVACLVTQQLEPEGFTWRHVGYLPRGTAAYLAPLWPEIGGIPIILHTTLKESSAGRNRTTNIYLDLGSPQYPDVIRFRDVSSWI